jgi:hypothetical protein
MIRTKYEKNRISPNSILLDFGLRVYIYIWKDFSRLFPCRVDIDM